MPTLFPPEYPDRPDAPLLSFGPSFSEEIARSVIGAVWHENNEQPHEAQVRVAAALTMLEAFHPRDHLECMLAAQGVAAHAMIMECFRRAMHPDTAEAVAIKLRGNAVQLSRMFSTLLRDMERRQSKPLPERPKPPLLPPVSGSPPDNHPMTDGPALDDPAPDNPAGAKSRPKRTREKGAPPKGSGTAVSGPNKASAEASDPGGPPPGRALNLEDVPELPEDIETRPDGSPGSLAAYAPKPPVEEFIPREPAIMVALATRPGPYRMVNTPKDGAPAKAGENPVPKGSAVPPAPDATMPNATTPGGLAADAPAATREQSGARGPLDLRERMFTGDALARFASARFDPDAPIEPLRFDDEDSVVELELISTGGDPEAEARRAAMIADHPEGKPIVTFRHGTKKPPDEAMDTPGDETPEDG